MLFSILDAKDCVLAWKTSSFQDLISNFLFEGVLKVVTDFFVLFLGTLLLVIR